ncbi:MAG: androgen-induced gene 1 family protein [Rhodobacteraceae bacterium]|nr:androgen-induced gene 1 family protein [Paracoccaceae bacterium]
MAAHPKGWVLNYRWVVFLLALGFWFYQFSQTSLDHFGWQFRFLTIWGLTAALITSWLMLRLSLGRSERQFNAIVSATAVLEVMVVFLYWKLWFTDPALVNSDGPNPWYQEYYLHALGPALMLFDAFFILGAFHSLWRTCLIVLAIFVGYTVWVEVLVAPLNSFPEGSATHGLPYPFLNDMAMDQRLVFYGTTIGTGLALMLIGWVLAQIIARLRGVPRR